MATYKIYNTVLEKQKKPQKYEIMIVRKRVKDPIFGQTT